MDANVKYAGFWIRFVACFLDGIILGVASAIILIIIKLLLPDLSKADTQQINDIFNLFINTAYYMLFLSSKHMATPGKMAVGIIVIGEDGGAISPLRAFGRSWAQLLSLIPLGAGYIMVAFHPQKRALHDLICKTYVIYKPNTQKII